MPTLEVASDTKIHHKDKKTDALNHLDTIIPGNNLLRIFKKRADKQSEYPDKDLRAVITQVLEKNPESAFCFLNENRLSQRAMQLQQLFLPDYAESYVTYAVKANPFHRILEILLASGITYFDCASVGEIGDVIRAAYKIRGETRGRVGILFNHPIKKRSDIHEAASGKVKHFTVQSLIETEKVLVETSNLKKIEIAVRLETLNKKAAINLSSKFGASLEEAERIFEFLKQVPKASRCISINLGSQTSDPEAYSKGIKLVAEFLKKHGPFATINLGGGFPVNYHPDENHKLDEFFGVINRDVYRYLGEALENKTKIFIEPGRSMIAEAVDLVIPVLAREKLGENECLYLDDGIFTSFSDSVIHSWKYHFRFLKADGEEAVGDLKSCLVFGRTCDSGDKLGMIDIPADIVEGDFVWVPKAGAYLDSQATRFNGFEPPQYISYNPTPQNLIH